MSGARDNHEFVRELARRVAGVSLDQLWSICLQELRLRNVKSICYGALYSRLEVEGRGLTKALLFKTNHPKAWIDAFGADKVLDQDETALKCMMGSQPIFWDVEKALRSPDPRIRERAAIERAVGFNVGVTLPAAYFTEGAIGGIGMAMDVPRSEFRAYWDRYQTEIISICTLLDTLMRRQHMSELVGLTRREKQCLTLLAVGERIGQIAPRLQITEGVVETHVFNAKTKLKARTRDQAVAKALLFRMISP